MIFSKRTWVRIALFSVLIFTVVFCLYEAELWLRVVLSLLLATTTFCYVSLIAINVEIEEMDFYRKLWEDDEEDV